MEDLYKLSHDQPSRKDYIETACFDQDEFLDMIKISRVVRDYLKDGGRLYSMHHKSLGMIFEQKSTRTRVSFEVAMEQLDGHALNLAPGAIQMGKHETVADTAKVIGRMCDMIMSRVDRHETIVELAENSAVPVINGMSDYNHPTQALGDMITITDHLPAGKEYKDLKVVFVGDCTQVCASLCEVTTKLGMHFVHYAPKAKWLGEQYLQIARKNVEKYGGSVEVSDDPKCLEGADFLYSDVWYGLYDKETPKEVYMADFYPKYQVNDDMIAATKNPNVKFLHCLPANRNEEVTDSVLDGEHCAAWDQAENRLTAQRGLLIYFGGVAKPTLEYIKNNQKEQ